MPTREEIMGELAEQGLGELDPYGGAAEVPLGALADQTAYDPFERAAARTRFGAKPLGGRQEGVATTLPQEILAAPVRAAAGFTKAAFDRAAEEHGGVSQISTDYDPRRMGALLGAETALNTTGFGTPFSQAGALGSAGGKAVMGQLAEQAPPFYSAVERAVQGAKQNVAPGQQWAGYLRNQPGVKPEEIEALKLGQLFEQPGAVPKQAVLDQIAANRVNVGEVVKGGDRPTQWTVTTAGGPAVENPTVAFSTREAAEVEWSRRHRLSPDAFHSVAELPTGQSKTKFESYTLPGGENYREMLLTLPEGQTGQVARAASVRANELSRETADAMANWKQLAEVNPPGHPQTLEAYARVSELRKQRDLAQSESARLYQEHSGKQYKSSHYDEPNILAHVRYNDRVIDGKKTLFVEEVQSDWHQAGRTKGYGSEEQRKQAISDQLNILNKEYEALPADQRGPVIDRMNALHDQMTEVLRGGGVPDAPFKTTWPELAMKRVIREAAEKGYDKVAWTPGSVQAARYDLSKHLSSVAYNEESKTLTAWNKQNKEVIRQHNVDHDKLADHIGKEGADKLLNSPTDQIGVVRMLNGVDLQVGGEGMKGFYDEILPSTVNKLVKKHGGRVQQGGFATNAEGWHITPPDQTTHGKWMVKSSDYNSKGLRFDTEAEAQAALAEKMKQNQVHTFDITPSLREQALKKGFPLFTAGGTAVMGGLAAQDQYQR